jgi:hypothetical protein
MKKTLIGLAVASMMMFSVGSAVAADDDGMGDKFRGMEKQTHMKAFPNGHPATKNPLNRCFYDEKDSLFFCQFPLTTAN